MADYCTQCSIALDAPEGWSDFKDITPQTPDEDVEFYVVLCEGCDTPNGVTIVNALGECVDPNCKCCPEEATRRS